jgi:hypothetical protein
MSTNSNKKNSIVTDQQSTIEKYSISQSPLKKKKISKQGLTVTAFNVSKDNYIKEQTIVLPPTGIEYPFLKKRPIFI